MSIEIDTDLLVEVEDRLARLSDTGPEDATENKAQWCEARGVDQAALMTMAKANARAIVQASREAGLTDAEMVAVGLMRGFTLAVEAERLLRERRDLGA